MSERACYLSRSERGGRLTDVRLIGERTDESWRETSTGPQDAAERSAAWVAERLARGAEGGAGLRVVCIDVDGAACAWLTAPSGDPQVVAALVAQGGSSWTAGDGATPGQFAAATSMDASIQALAVAPAPSWRSRVQGLARRSKESRPAGERLAVLSIPDVPARLFLDALDDRGAAPDRVMSLWHALAAAWDPGGAHAAQEDGPNGDRVVATSSPATAVVLIDRDAGRLVWCWSCSGEVLAGGSMRLAVDRSGEAASPRLGEADVGRLATDWLAWASQLGAAPSRIVVIGPRLSEEDGGMGAGELGEALGRAWPGAMVNFAVHQDPVGATLHRLLGLPSIEGGPRTTLLSLTNRPSRAHRALIRAGALAMAAGALGLGAIAWKSWTSANEARSMASALADETRAEITKVVPRAEMSQFPERDLAAEVNKLRTARETPRELESDMVKPILEELDTLSFVLSSFPGVEAEEYNLRTDSVIVSLKVPDLHTGEAVLQSMREIGGSQCEWKGDPRQVGDKLALTLTGAWRIGGGRP